MTLSDDINSHISSSDRSLIYKYLWLIMKVALTWVAAIRFSIDLNCLLRLLGLTKLRVMLVTFPYEFIFNLSYVFFAAQWNNRRTATTMFRLTCKSFIWMNKLIKFNCKYVSVSVRFAHFFDLFCRVSYSLLVIHRHLTLL